MSSSINSQGKMAAGTRALLIAVSCFIVVVVSASGGDTVAGACVQCLCEAVSGGPSCVFGAGRCHSGVCGPFAITHPYWQDAGRPTVALDDRSTVTTYEKCALDPACALATIQGYMAKFHQDCTGDGVEDCQDYARIHFHGGYGCNKPLAVPNRNALDACLRRINAEKPAVNVAVPDEFWKQDDREPPTPLPAIDVRLGESN